MASSPTPTRISGQKFSRLAADLQAGSNAALAPLLELYRPYLLATAAVRLNKALKAKAGPSDLVQETLAQAYQEFPKLEKKPETEAELRLWLRNILSERLKAIHRRYYRAKRRIVSRESSLDEGISKQLLAQLARKHDETPAALVDRKLLVERLEGALDRLSPAYKQIIVWRNYDGRQFADIARQLERSPDAVRMLWNRAMRQLKKELGSHDA